MNRENILKVADAIEQHSIPDLGFNMAEYVAPADEWHVSADGRSCGTVACIAGWATAVIGGAMPVKRAGEYFYSEARDWMGLSHNAADMLFYAFGRKGILLKDVTPAHAVAVLRHLAATGEVDWSIGAPEATNA